MMKSYYTYRLKGMSLSLTYEFINANKCIFLQLNELIILICFMMPFHDIPFLFAINEQYNYIYALFEIVLKMFLAVLTKCNLLSLQ